MSWFVCKCRSLRRQVFVNVYVSVWVFMVVDLEFLSIIYAGIHVPSVLFPSLCLLSRSFIPKSFNRNRTWYNWLLHLLFIHTVCLYDSKKINIHSFIHNPSLRTELITTSLVFLPAASAMPENRRFGRRVYCSHVSAFSSSDWTFLVSLTASCLFQLRQSNAQILGHKVCNLFRETHHEMFVHQLSGQSVIAGWAFLAWFRPGVHLRLHWRCLLSMVIVFSLCMCGCSLEDKCANVNGSRQYASICLGDNVCKKYYKTPYNLNYFLQLLNFSSLILYTYTHIRLQNRLL